MNLIFFNARTTFSMDASHLSPLCLLAVIPLIGDVTGVVLTRPCPGYLAGPPLCSVVVTALSGAGSIP